jgi:(1->4)-alpha-D-glucan 1-alpha-D-glucosylmutase
VSAPPPARLPVSSYRLQLSPGFGFAEAASLVPYLAGIGVSECYCSPILAARPGSAHGYDICDHARLNPDLGGDEGFANLVAVAREHDVGLLVDFVPNHMSADAAANRWWRSVLENGPSSPFAHYFDIDWEPSKSELRGKVLLPVLGDQYGIILEAGQVRVELSDGGLRLRYFDLDLPLNPRRWRALLEHDLAELRRELPVDDADLNEFQSVLFHLEHLPAYTETDRSLIRERAREKEVARARLGAVLERSAAIRTHVERNVRAFNGTAGHPISFDSLHALLEAQPYRLASWRTAMHEINYRRFFDVNELVGLRMEEPEVFEATHALLGRLVRAGAVTGLRLDHVDGLFDPLAYLRRLAEEVAPARPWIVVEKILGPGERVEERWPVHGTTGYEFLNAVNDLFVDRHGLEAIRLLYQRLTRENQPFEDMEYAGKRLIIATSMASELNVLADELNRISENDRRFRDFTLDSLQEALHEIVACFPVYRTYVGPAGYTPRDAAAVDGAITTALDRNPAMEPTIFEFIRQMLLPAADAAGSDEVARRHLRFAMKFQQYTGPVHAKGVEDTAFYRYGPLIARNEVGGTPGLVEEPVGRFHRMNQERLAAWPFAMSTTATHDTKRGEDARVRLDVLTEIPRRWSALVARWNRLNAPARRQVGGRPAPDPHDEYLFYQALIGAWPASRTAMPDLHLVDRMTGFMRKAIREAKVHTSWLNPSQAYEDGVLGFVTDTLAGPSAPAFLRSFVPFARRVASVGAINSLTQLVLKIGSPGVADFYQGSELWDVNLVDPDNRGPVDFARRRELWSSVAPLLDRQADPEAVAIEVRRLLRAWPDGRIKMLATAAGLRLRRANPRLFLEGEYHPLEANGRLANHVVGFARRSSGAALIVVGVRLAAALMPDSTRPPVGERIWTDTSIDLPADLAGAGWTDVLTGRRLAPRPDGRPVLSLGRAFEVLPVALLTTTLASAEPLERPRKEPAP